MNILCIVGRWVLVSGTDELTRYAEKIECTLLQRLGGPVFKLKLKYNFDYRINTVKLKSNAECER